MQPRQRSRLETSESARRGASLTSSSLAALDSLVIRHPSEWFSAQAFSTSQGVSCWVWPHVGGQDEHLAMECNGFAGIEKQRSDALAVLSYA